MTFKWSTVVAAVLSCWSLAALTLLIFAKSTGGSYLIAPYSWPVTTENLFVGVCYCLAATAGGRALAFLLADRHAWFSVGVSAALALALASTIVWPAPFLATDDDVVKYVRAYIAPRLFLSAAIVFMISFLLRTPTEERSIDATDGGEENVAPSGRPPIIWYGRSADGHRRLALFLAASIVASAAAGCVLRLARGRLPLGLPTYVRIDAQFFFLLSVPLVILAAIISTSTRSSPALRLTLLANSLLASLAASFAF